MLQKFILSFEFNGNPYYNELPEDESEIDVRNCNKINISMTTLQNIPKVVIHNVSEVVFHEDSKRVTNDVDPFIRQFSMSMSNVNLIPDGLFRDAHYSTIVIKNCNITSIGSNAFHHLKVDILNIYDTNITEVKSQAFHDVKADQVFIKKVVLLNECKCEMHKIVSLEHEHKLIDIESRSMTKALAEKKILDNLYCLLGGYRYHWALFDTEHCDHGLDEKITGVLKGNHQNIMVIYMRK